MFCRNEGKQMASCRLTKASTNASAAGAPVVIGRKIIDVSRNISDVLNFYNITAQQYLGGSFDGEYHNIHVPEYLDKFFGFEGINRNTVIMIHYTEQGYKISTSGNIRNLNGLKQ